MRERIIDMAYLVYVEGDNKGKRVDLPSTGVVVLGRTTEKCDLLIEGETISGKHCSIEKTDAGYVVKDLGSTNKTWINGSSITEASLYKGDELGLGDTLLMVEGDDVPERPVETVKEEEPIYSDSGTKIMQVVPRSISSGKVKIPTDFSRKKNGSKIWSVVIGLSIIVVIVLLYFYISG